MKICSIHIKGFQQFQDTFLDFTDPETGEPAEKICFIGPNGTGKSTLLELINSLLGENPYSPRINKWGFIFIKIKSQGKAFSLIKGNDSTKIYLISNDVERYDLLENELKKTEIDYVKLYKLLSAFVPESNQLHSRGMKGGIWKNFLFDTSGQSDLSIYSPAESQTSSYSQIEDVPKSSVSEALPLLKGVPARHEVSADKVNEFWKFLIYHIKKRENDRNEFENSKENLDKTKRELIQAFDQVNPKILDSLAKIWDKILAPANLELDVDGASNPIQLTDNLQAYIKLKSTGERIEYHQLSTGIRNFIFRIGHIYSLYFNREIKRGFLLIDEPENSLFPNFLFELVETYQEIIKDKNGENNTQVFMATHNPIIAAQFKPHERIILEWDEEGSLVVMKGKAAEGDDPNDVLKQDFHLPHLMGKKGLEMWDEYLELRKKLRRTENKEEKKDLVGKISKIGRDYNFD